jgi:3'(2'), 5'-bisphosphate nucleotidase
MKGRESDAQLARRVAEATGRLLLEIRRTADVDSVAGLQAMRDEGDRRANAAITEALALERPADAILSEESVDSGRRLEADRVWIVDPLDGTREFGERDAAGVWRDDFAVHVALWERGSGLVAGAVAMPARGVTHWTDAPASVPQAGVGRLRLAVSRTRPPAFLEALSARGAATLVPLGSAGVKAMAVLSGEVDAYVHAGGQYQWDSAAPVAVALAAGFVATRLDGSSLRYNDADLSLPDLLICHPARIDEVRTLLTEVGVGPERRRDARGAESP